jgi:hypothetical protein
MSSEFRERLLLRKHHAHFPLIQRADILKTGSTGQRVVYMNVLCTQPILYVLLSRRVALLNTRRYESLDPGL